MSKNHLSHIYNVNVNHWQSVHILVYSACVCGKAKTLVVFKINQQAYFWNECPNIFCWEKDSISIKISSKLSLTCDWNFSYYKSVYHPFPTCGNKEHPSNFQNKSLSSPFSWVSRYILFLAKLKGKGRPFLKVARRKPTLWDYPEEHLVVIIRDEKVSPFVKFERILLFLCLSLAPFTNKHCSTRSSMMLNSMELN